MSELEAVLAALKELQKNQVDQHVIIANQEAILANQAVIKTNQEILNTLIQSQIQLKEHIRDFRDDMLKV